MTHRQIDWIGIPTCDRPDSFNDCLQSFADCLVDHGRTAKLLIVDQTKDESQSQLNRQAATNVARQSDNEVWFAGENEVRHFVKELSNHAGLPDTVVAHACLGDEAFPFKAGANRNSLLLATAGNMLLQVDDDTICSLEPCPGAKTKERLCLTSHYACMEYWFPSPSQNRRQEESPHKEDICALHEELLGKTIDQCIYDYGPARHSHWSPNMEGSSTVLATTIGVTGDSTVHTKLFLLQSTGPQRERLVKNEKIYRHLMKESQVQRAVRRRTISNRGLVSGANFAVDNRKFLPPFTPVQRSEDSVFTVLLRTCFDGAVGYLPWMVKHRRPVRRNSEDPTAQRSHTLAGDIVKLIVLNLAAELSAPTPEEKISALGNLFVEWGCATPSKFQEMVRSLVAASHSQQLAMLDMVLEQHESQPDFWASDVRLYRSWIEKGLTHPELDVTSDLEEVFQTEARAKFQEMIVRFGELLQVWPGLHLGAKELHGQGLRLGTRL